MSSAHTLPIALDRCYRNDFFRVADPGASGTFSISGKGLGVARVVTAAAESRALPAVTAVAPGEKLIVLFKTDAGDLTITGAESNVVLSNAGDVVEFTVGVSGADNVWRVTGDSRLATQSFGSKTISLPLDDDWRVWDSIVTNLAGADGTDDLGLVTGTYLTSAPTFNVTVATPSSAPFYARKTIVVPNDYKAGTALTLSVTATETVAATTANLDASIVRQAAPSVDIVATAAQSIIGATATVFTFTVTGTNVVPGEVLDLRVLITLNDVSATPNYSIGAISLAYTAG